MIPRYSRPEMARLWSDENRFATWLEVEIAATAVLAERGVVPKEALAAIRERARFDIQRIEEIEREVQHDVIAFVSCVAESVGPEGRYLHYGLTSSDVVDTALSILMRDAIDLVRADLVDLMDAVRERAFRHKHAAMIGRTHGVHAEPMTFGLKLALWHAELQRQLGGSTALAPRSPTASSRARWERSRTCRPRSRRQCARSSGCCRRPSPRRSFSATATPR